MMLDISKETEATNFENMTRPWGLVSSLILLVQCISNNSVLVNCFEIPLPGGGRIKVEDGGILRIQLSPETALPKSPPVGTLPFESTLSSVEVRDTGTVKGYGAFCAAPLEKFSFLGFYEGALVESREVLEKVNKRRSMDYVMSLDGGYTFLDGFDRAQDRDIFSPVHLNHEDKGEVGCNCVRVLSEGQVAFFTSRNVHIGEELCFNYGVNYWQGREAQKI
jgi:hypothetical protein